MSVAPVLLSSLVSLAAAGDWREVPLQEAMRRFEATVPASLSAAGIALDVGPAGAVAAFAMPGVRGLRLRIEADGLFSVVYAALREGDRRVYGPPMRHVTLRPGATTVRLDLVETPGWTPSSRPMLLLDGSGRVTIRSVEILPPPATAAEAAEARDAAGLWGAESFGHTTVNTLTVPYWKFTKEMSLARALAAVLAAAVAIALAAIRWRRGRWAPASALAAAALVAVGAWNVLFLIRYVPATDLAPSLGTDARLREGYRFAPELGEVAAAARAAIRPEERVGVVAPPKDWFLAQTLCYALAPRRCVRVRPGEEVYAGISEIERLRPGELDAVVSFMGAGYLPPGFVPRVQITKRALIARRP